MNSQTDSVINNVKTVIGCALAILLLGGWQTAAAQNSNTLGASAKVLQNIVVGNTTKSLSFGRLQVYSGRNIVPESPVPFGIGGNSSVQISGSLGHRGYVSITFVNGEEFALEITAPEYLDHTSADAQMSFTLESRTDDSMLGLITQTDVPNNEDSEFTAIPGGEGNDFTVDRSGTDTEVWSTGTTPGTGVTMPGSTVYLVLGGVVQDNVAINNGLTSTEGNYTGTIQIKATIIN